MLIGPLYVWSTLGLDQDIVTHFRKGLGPSILVTMGSSGMEGFFFEAVRALKLESDVD